MNPQGSLTSLVKDRSLPSPSFAMCVSFVEHSVKSGEVFSCGEAVSCPSTGLGESEARCRGRAAVGRDWVLHRGSWECRSERRSLKRRVAESDPPVHLGLGAEEEDDDGSDKKLGSDFRTSTPSRYLPPWSLAPAPPRSQPRGQGLAGRGRASEGSASFTEPCR